MIPSIFKFIVSNNLLLILFISLSVALNTGGQIFLKLGSGQNPLNPYLFGGIVFYGISTLFYVLVLGKYNLSVAYPVVIGLTLITTTVSSIFFLKETVSFTQWIGIGLMISAICAISLGKSL